MLYYCTLTAIIEVSVKTASFLCVTDSYVIIFFMQSHARGYLTSRGALPTMWGEDKRKRQERRLRQARKLKI